ncbi:MAG TPA: polynucleotide adenylyltransferase PcnB [Polyangia bacterium]|nr:polynucleotide adenylyltransferase PcnB [Polyangia bacterium]
MQIAPDQIDPDAAKVVQRLRNNDHLAYLVGGCVRDLLLGLKPKDFDVVTSATPNEIKRLFGNSRIIGRRFKLAHVFYGPKIIETATFRANPRELEDENGDGGDAESGDLLIRRDNVFGTPEEDARRRDFTINGLFYDMKTGQVIDHVSGIADLEARLVRTIGDPDIRFREDPIRILRAVKFAARCSLAIEPETYRRMMEHRSEIAKCAQARVSEEFYRLLRAGAAKRSMELLVETELLEILSPELARALRPTPHETQGEAADAEVHDLRRARLWAYLAALDRSTERKPTQPSNALILAALFLPWVRDALDPATRGQGDVGQLVAQALAPAIEQLKPSRRDSELARQILLAFRRREVPKEWRGRDFYEDALRLRELIADAEALDTAIAGRPLAGEAEDGAGVTDDLDAEPGASDLDGRRRRRGRRGRGRLREDDRPGAGASPSPRAAEPAVASGPRSSSGGPHARPAPAVPVDLESLFAAARSLASAAPRPSFLGGGGFGGPWASHD